MAFDGITIAAITKELKTSLIGGRIYKIAQPEADELLLTIKTTEGGQKRLLLSASASLPLVYLTDNNKPRPMTAPGFCMLLRKHLGNATLVDIQQEGLDRILKLVFSSVNELGDRVTRTLVIEIMAQYSNIILLDESAR